MLSLFADGGDSPSVAAFGVPAVIRRFGGRLRSVYSGSPVHPSAVLRRAKVGVPTRSVRVFSAGVDRVSDDQHHRHSRVLVFFEIISAIGVGEVCGSRSVVCLCLLGGGSSDADAMCGGVPNHGADLLLQVHVRPLRRSPGGELSAQQMVSDEAAFLLLLVRRGVGGVCDNLRLQSGNSGLFFLSCRRDRRSPRFCHLVCFLKHRTRTRNVQISPKMNDWLLARHKLIPWDYM